MMQIRTMQDVETAVLDGYLETGKAMTVNEIVSRSNRSDTITRRALDESRRITRTQTTVPIMSKNYLGIIHQHRTVDAFLPSRLWLAELLLQSRREHHYDRTERKFGR
jgi:hypothetical protein